MSEQTAVPSENMRLETAAAYIGMSPQFLRKAHRMGTGPERIRLGKCIIFRKSSLDAFLQARIEVRSAR